MTAPAYAKRSRLNHLITKLLFKWFSRRLHQLERMDKGGKRPSWFKNDYVGADYYNGRIISWYLQYYNAWWIRINYLFSYRFEDGKVTYRFMNPIVEYRKAKFAERVVKKMLSKQEEGEE